MDFQTFGTDFGKMDTGKVVTTMINGNKVFIKKDSADEVSIFSGGIPIRQIQVSDQKHMNEHIEKAMDSVQFLKEYGLDAIGINIPNLVDLINERPSINNGRILNLSDGVNTEEQRILMQTLARLADMEIPTGSPAEVLDRLKNDFHTLSQGDGLISRLRKAGYIETDSNALDMFAVKEGMEKMKEEKRSL